MRLLSQHLGWLLAATISILVLAAAAAVVRGGALDPSSPPGPTMKTLDEVEPRIPVHQPADASGFPVVIGAPGSYYLAENITGVAAKGGIQINADDVTFDLNGFTISGVPGAGNGISPGAACPCSGWTLKSGTIESWPQLAIYTLNASESRFEELIIRNNGGGINGGVSVSVRDSIFSDNDNYAIKLGVLAQISDVIIDGKFQPVTGIEVDDHAIVRGCSLGGMLYGIIAGFASEIYGCNIRAVTTGVKVDASSFVHDNSFDQNDCAIDVAGGGSRIDGNKITYNLTGFGICNSTNTPGTIVAVRNSFWTVPQPFEADVVGEAPLEDAATSTNPWANLRYEDIPP